VLSVGVFQHRASSILTSIEHLHQASVGLPTVERTEEVIERQHQATFKRESHDEVPSLKQSDVEREAFEPRIGIEPAFDCRPSRGRAR
jgi:hypothetical protein